MPFSHPFSPRWSRCMSGPVFLQEFSGASYVLDKPRPNPSHFGSEPEWNHDCFGRVSLVAVRPSSSVLRLKSGAIMSQSDATQASWIRAGGNLMFCPRCGKETDREYDILF